MKHVFDFFGQLFSLDRRGRGAPSTQLLFIVSGLFVIFLVWASFVELDQVVSAEGKVVPFSQLQVIEHYEGGRVKEIFVRPGDQVDIGALLISLSPLQTAGDFNVQKENLAFMTVRLARLNAEYIGKLSFTVASDLKISAKEFYVSELALFRDRQSQNRSNLAKLRSDIDASLARLISSRARLSATKEEFEVTRQLVARGLEARLSLIRAQGVLAEAGSTFTSAEQDLKRAEASYQSARSQRREEILAELTTVRTDLSQAKETLLVSADKADRTEIRSPTKGTVNRVLVSTTGSTVNPGEPVVEIVPADARLVINADVMPQDIGFIRRGQTALIKFSAYDYSVYGPKEGVVNIVGSDAVEFGESGQTSYVVKLDLDGPYVGLNAEILPIIPGMQVQLDIITGKRTLMAYFFSPFSRALQSSFRER